MRGLKDEEPETLKNYLQDLARATEGVLPPGPSQSGRALFILLLVDNEDLKPRAHYVSNADRDDIITFLRSTADRLEQRGEAE